MLNSGVLPDDLDNQNYFELLETLNARSRDDRPMNPEDAHAQLSKMFGGG